MKNKYFNKIIMLGILLLIFTTTVLKPMTACASQFTYDDFEFTEEDKQRMQEALEEQKMNSMNGIRGNCDYVSLFETCSAYSYIMNHPAFPFDDVKNAVFLDVAQFLAENPAFVENGITSAEQIITWYQVEGYKTQCKLYVTDSAPFRVQRANLCRNKAIEYGVYLNGSMTMADKVKIINDKMCNDFEYDYGMYFYNYTMDYKEGYIYGICMDYAAYFEVIAAYAGINSGIVNSDISNHCWNAVLLEDGQCLCNRPEFLD